MMRQPSGPSGGKDETAALKARGDALRQAAALDGADLRPLMQAALTELDAAVEALASSGEPTGDGQDGSATSALHAERRLLHTLFQQAPVPLFLLDRDS